MCPSPGGLHPCDCVHEVESGSQIDEVVDEKGLRHALINHPNGTMSRLEACPYSPPPAPAPPSSASLSDPSNICGLGFAHGTPMSAFYQHTKDVMNFTATYTVPNSPSSASSQDLYYWIGLQDTSSSANPVIQPVLSFRDSTSWYFESWNCCPAGHKLKAPTVPVEPGATLYGAMEKSDDGLYKIVSTNSAGDSSVLYSNDTASGIVSSWNWVEVVLETYYVDSCSMYSDGGAMKFLDMSLVDTDGQALTPTWVLNDYIGTQYLTSEGTQTYQDCCNGTFSLDWPNAVIEQNPSGTSALV